MVLEPSETEIRKFTVPDAMGQTCRFCAPLFFINALALFGMAELPNAEAPNGTVTFVGFEGKTYAVIANHVVEILRERAREAHGDGWLFSTLLGGKGNSVIERTIPSLPDIFVQPAGVYPEKAPDIAIMRIGDAFPEHIGKAAFPFERDSNLNAPVAHAVGYPTGEKFDVFDEKGRRVGMNCVTAVAERASDVRYFSHIPEVPEIKSLSGMSGGPVFVPDGETIALAGIIVEGSPFGFETPLKAADQSGLTERPRVSFAVQRMTADLLRTWVAGMPH
jgi:hypothetical protein